MLKIDRIVIIQNPAFVTQEFHGFQFMDDSRSEECFEMHCVDGEITSFGLFEFIF